MLDFLVELVLDFFGFLLLEKDLVFVIDFSLRQSLVTLLPNFVQTLVESDLL